MIGALTEAALAYWRRHPLRLATLLTGLALATALWTGVQAINAEARAAYDRAASEVSAGLSRLTAEGGVRPESFAALRRAGWLVSPVVEGLLPGVDGVRVLGFDPLTFPQGTAPARVDRTDIAGFLRGETALAAPGTAERVPGSVADPRLPEGLVVVDIAAAMARLGRERFDHLVVDPVQPLIRPPLERVAPDLRLHGAGTGVDAARLTRSFHLNLTAFGLLSFAVGLFIVHGAVGLAIEERRTTFRTLRALGVPRNAVLGGMATELLGLALVAGAIGVAAGWAVAAALLPGVAATLGGLYGAEVPGTLTLSPVWWAGGLLVALAGAALASATSLLRLARLPILAAARPRAWARTTARARRRQALGAAAALIAGLLAWQGAGGLGGGFALLAGLLLGAAFALPLALEAVLARLPARGAVAEWRLADARQALPGMSLALMALLLALAANIGVSTMVGSFRLTFEDWLDQRLSAAIYLDLPDPGDAEALRSFAEARGGGAQPIWQADTRAFGLPLEIRSAPVLPALQERWPVISATDDAWKALAAGEGVMVSEQLWRREGLGTGDLLPLPGGGLRIVGVYPDYGNPIAQALLDPAEMEARFTGIDRESWALDLPEAALDGLPQALSERFGIGRDGFVRQDALKALSLSIFERTFLVTDALNLLTLAVAGVAMATSLLTLAALRLPQVAPVWAMGLTRRALARAELLRAVMLALLTFVFAVPLGLALAWVLLAVVNVEAFGWRLPMHVFPAQWLLLGAVTALAAALAGAGPAWRLARRPPSDLLRVFADAR